jgi:hypothetical protein
VALELSGASWKIALHDGKRDKPAIYTVSEEAPAPRLLHAVAVIEAVRQKWYVPQDALVTVIYEAGQDGFWISPRLVCTWAIRYWWWTRPAFRWNVTLVAPRTDRSMRSGWSVPARLGAW